jgi:hypothetical protein
MSDERAVGLDGTLATAGYPLPIGALLSHAPQNALSVTISLGAGWDSNIRFRLAQA